jgi:hypothetical protein
MGGSNSPFKQGYRHLAEGLEDAARQTFQALFFEEGEWLTHNIFSYNNIGLISSETMPSARANGY